MSNCEDFTFDSWSDWQKHPALIVVLALGQPWRPSDAKHCDGGTREDADRKQTETAKALGGVDTPLSRDDATVGSPQSVAA